MYLVLVYERRLAVVAIVGREEILERVGIVEILNTVKRRIVREDREKRKLIAKTGTIKKL